MVDINSTSNILNEYEEKRDLYAELCDKIEMLVSDLLIENNVEVHSVDARPKSPESLEAKVSQPDAHYEKLYDITDLCGLRIITFFSDDVSKVAKIIEQEFEIDRAKSVDKGSELDPDQFGYRSIHFVAGLSTVRSRLMEYRRFIECKFEIQIRSILQHAWAEIEHDLGYKSKIAIPREIRRRFSRVAGLLELADTEFEGIRRALSDYAAEVLQKISDSPEEVSIDKDSLAAFIDSDETLGRIDLRVVYMAGSDEIDLQGDVEGLVGRLHFVGINTVAQLEKSLDANEEDLVKFASIWLNARKSPVRNRKEHFGRGDSLLHLVAVLLGRNFSEDEIKGYYRDVANLAGLPEEIIDIFTDDLRSAYQKANLEQG